MYTTDKCVLTALPTPHPPHSHTLSLHTPSTHSLVAGIISQHIEWKIVRYIWRSGPLEEQPVRPEGDVNTCVALPLIGGDVQTLVTPVRKYQLWRKHTKSCDCHVILMCHQTYIALVGADVVPLNHCITVFEFVSLVLKMVTIVC